MSLVAYGSSGESDEENVLNENVAVSFKKSEPDLPLNKVGVKYNGNIKDHHKSINLCNNNDDKGINEFSSEIDTTSGLTSNISDEEDDIKGGLKNNNLKNSKNTEDKSLLSLPAPKNVVHDIDFDWSQLTKRYKGTTQPVKISIPSLAELETEDSEEPIKKKLKPSKKGSGLFALLPSPKHTNLTKSLTPRQIKNKNPVKPIVRKENVKAKDNLRLSNKLPSVDYDDSADEDDGNEEGNEKVDFFSLSSPVCVPAADIRVPDIESIDIINEKEDNKMQQSTQGLLQGISEVGKPVQTTTSVETVTSLTNEHVTCPSTSSESYIPFNQEDIQLDETALQQLCGRRERQKRGSAIEIIDINGDAILPDAREWMTKQLTEEQNTSVQSHKKKDGPTTQQRRKHQITYLAFQAKEHELELKNQWANNRMSRKQTQAKYGF